MDQKIYRVRPDAMTKVGGVSKTQVSIDRRFSMAAKIHSLWRAPSFFFGDGGAFTNANPRPADPSGAVWLIVPRLHVATNRWTVGDFWQMDRRKRHRLEAMAAAVYFSGAVAGTSIVASS